MQKLFALLTIMALLFASTGCVSETMLERARLNMEEAKAERDEARARADEARARADEAEAETEREKVAWDGRAMLIAVLSTSGMPYFFGSILILILFFVFMACAFPDKIFVRKGGKNEADDAG